MPPEVAPQAPAPAVISTPVEAPPFSPQAPLPVSQRPQVRTIEKRTIGNGKPPRFASSQDAAARAAIANKVTPPGTAPGPGAGVTKTPVTPTVAPATAAPPAPGAASPAPDPNATPTPLPASSAPAPGSPPALAAVSEPPALDTPPGEALPPTVDATELARRTARLHRREEKHQEDVRRFNAERQQYTQAIQRIQTFEQLATQSRNNPVAFAKMMHQTFGISPQQLIDIQLGESTKAPEIRQAEQVQDTVKNALAPYQQELDRKAKELEAQRQQIQAAEYVRGTLAPIVADKTAYAFLNHKHGSEAAQIIYDTQIATWRNRMGKWQAAGSLGPQPVAPKPKEVADYIERSYRKEYEDSKKLEASLRGPSVTPPQPARTSGIEPPIVASPAPTTRQPQRESPIFTRRKPTKAYAVKVIPG